MLQPHLLVQLQRLGINIHEGFDGEGKALRRPFAQPYKPVTTFKKPTTIEATNAVWTDWLLEGNWDKYHELCRKHFGDESQLWFDREPKLIEAWLSDYMGKPVILLEIQHHRNSASWHHVWFFAIASK